MNALIKSALKNRGITLLIPLLALAFFAATQAESFDLSIWINITISGIAMGILIFHLAVGMTVIFGLMDVMNFAHGIFFTLGAFTSWSLYQNLLLDWVESDSLGLNVAALTIGILAAVLVSMICGWIMEKLIIRKVYGNHQSQILITIGVAIFLEELSRIFWSPENEAFTLPTWFLDSWEFGDVLVSRFQVFIIILGILLLFVLELIYRKTKIGLIVRAGIENPQMVKALGYNLDRVFSLVFVASAALAGLGGFLWAGYREVVNAGMGSEILIFALTVVIIGGLGSILGSFFGAILLGLAFNYTAFLFPSLTIGVNFFIMLVILLARPTGLFK